MKIRRASAGDLPEILQIYADAREFMRQNGNPDQWGYSYPTQEMLCSDIAAGKLYLCMKEEAIGAVFYFAVEEEPTYRVIEEGGWLSDAPYGVVHRIAAAREVRGAANFSLQWALAQTGNIRIDTHEKNLPMQGLLGKLGFTRCGRVWMEDGSPRWAYQKIV